jgi:hypothetical protein
MPGTIAAGSRPLQVWSISCSETCLCVRSASLRVRLHTEHGARSHEKRLNLRARMPFRKGEPRQFVTGTVSRADIEAENRRFMGLRT